MLSPLRHAKRKGRVRLFSSGWGDGRGLFLRLGRSRSMYERVGVSIGLVVVYPGSCVHSGVSGREDVNSQYHQDLQSIVSRTCVWTCAHRDRRGPDIVRT